MKKLSLILAGIASLVVASTSVAANEPSAYFTTKRPLLNYTAANTLPATDIIVINASISNIYTLIPGSSYYDLLYPGENDHLRRYFWYDDTHLVLQDPYLNTFFDSYVCRRAVVTVFSTDVGYRITIDSEYC